MLRKERVIHRYEALRADERLTVTLASVYPAERADKGTYKKLKYGSDPFSDPVYGFAAKAMGDVIAGEFVRAAEGAYVPAMRCYLKYNSTSTRGEIEELPERITVKLVGDPTSIGTLNTQTGEVTFDGWYSLDGQRFNTKPTKKGLYIYKGIKVTIK